MDCPTEFSECPGVPDVTPVPAVSRLKTDICLCYMNVDIVHLFVIANERFLIST